MSIHPSTQPTPEDPHEGSENDPRRELDRRDESAVVPPRRYEPEDAGAGLDPHRTQPTTLDRLAAASGPLSLIAFFVIGFSTGMWYVAWIVFLVPAAVHAWNKA
ncbi:MAG: hypothetical protein ABR500_08470 [Dermatophilaceae bacterium]|nr:hypothetical protein [Intrasporangiaceae bacterium]